MTNFVFNVAKGKVNDYVAKVDANDPANSALIIVLLKTADTDAVNKDYDTLSALLAAVNVEADFTNYARKTLTDADVTAPVPDDTGDKQDADFPDQTWTSAGGATNNTLAKLLVCYDADTTGGTDADLVPVAVLDCVVTFDVGVATTVAFNASGFARAA